MLGAAVILDRKDPCRFELDTGRGVWHLRTAWATDREVWVKNFQALGAPSKSADTVIAQLEARVEALNKNIAVAKSLEIVLSNRVDVLKVTPTGGNTLEAPNQDAVVLEESGEHHKKKEKKKGHSRQKSDAMEVQTGAFLSHTQEVQKSVGQLIVTIEEISNELSEAIARLSKATQDLHEGRLSGNASDAAKSSGKMGSSEDETKDGGIVSANEPMILYNEDNSGSDSEDYFDADDFDADDADDSSSSMEYFEPSPTQASKSARGSKKDHSAHADITSSNPQASSSAAAASSSAPSAVTGSSGNVSGSNSNTPAKKKKDHKSKRRLSRSFNEEGRQASLKLKLKPSGVAVKDTLAEIPEGWAPRAALPFDKPKGVSIPIMKILKDAVGKDISRITIPVSFSEPINMLQRMVEDFEYGEILLRAVEEPDPHMRLLYISAFAASSYASIYVRRTKPFNPLLGETYEYVDPERQFRLMTEQVSHHPPIAAFTVDSPGYTMWGHAHAKTKFWGKSLEINPTGRISLRLTKFDEVYTWNKITTCMNNVIVGSKWIDNYGELSVCNQTTGHKCLMDFKKQGWFGAHAYEIVGTVHDPDDTMTHKIEGLWNEYFSAIPVSPETGELNPAAKIELWRVNPLPDNAKQQYYFTSYTMRLNELPAWQKPLLPATDSRLRPDQRALEDAQTDLAQSEKSRLEDKQRAARKRLEESGLVYEPTWFARGEGDTWVYKGGYWEARTKKQWPANVPDIF